MVLPREKAQIATYIDLDLIKRIDECADALGMSRSKMVGELLEAAIEQNYKAIHAASKLLKAKSFFKDKLSTLTDHLKKVEGEESYE